MGINNGYEGESYEKVRSTTHTALVLNGTTYVSLGMLIRLKNYYIAEDYDDRVYLDLLKSLEIRIYDENGKFDRVISAPFDMEGENRFNPEKYYDENEKAFVGTAEDFQNFDFKHTEINGYYFPQSAEKRILVDDKNRVIAIFPYENFRHESVNPSGGGTSLWENVENEGPQLYVGESKNNMFANKTFLRTDVISNFEKRGGFNIFLLTGKKDKNGNSYSACLDYCYVDFRYFVN